MTVSQTPATNGDLGEKQIQLMPEDPYANGFVEAFDETAPRRVDDTEWTTIDGTTITAYAPTFDNLDSYFGKIVTVIFGKDNEVVSIRVVDETVEDEYLTAYDATGTVSNFTIGGEKYKFADGAKVYANTILQDGTADEALVALFGDLGITESDTDKYKDFTKVIKANVSLNNKGKVTRLDLFVSGTYAIENLKTVEGIVTKIRNEKITLQYTAGDSVEELVYDMSDLDEDELPRIIKDGAIASVKDIEVGNVLTYYYGEDTEDIKTVYISANVANGEVTRAKKTDLRIYTEEGDYVPSMGRIFLTDDKLTDAEKVEDANSLVGETVELYLNIYGEYVLAVVEDVEDGNWKFGYIKSIKEFKQVEDGDDYEAVVRMLLDDGTTTSKAYKIAAEEDEIDDAETFLTDTDKTGFVAFKVSGEMIEWDEIIFIDAATGDLEAHEVDADILDEFADEYEVITTLVKDNAVNNDRKRIYDNVDADAVDAKNYKFLSSSIIYNVDEDELGVSTKWGMLVTAGATKKLNANTLVIVEKDEDDILYAIIDVEGAPSSDAMYAVVSDDHTKVKEDGKYRYYLELVDEDNAEGEKIYAERDDDAEADVKAVEIDSFVEYVLADDEIRTIKELVKLVKFAELKSDENVTDEIVADGEETTLAVTLVEADAGNDVVGTTKANFKVIETETDLIKYEDDEDEVEDSFDELEIDEDAIIYDLRDGGFKTMTFKDLAAEVAEGDVYVIPFANNDIEADADANILVVVD